MAVTHQDYTGNGSETDYNITAFPFLETSDVNVSVAGVTKTVVNDYTISGTTLTFTSSAVPANNAAIRIYRNTNADAAKHTHQAGASVKAGDLNDNQKQVLYKLQEVNGATASGTGLALVAGDKNDITVNSANDWVIRTGAIEAAMLADNSVTAAKFANSVMSTNKIADDAITADKLANSINAEIAANTTKTTNATHSGEVTGATTLTIADNVVDEANLKVSNSPTNGYYLTAQSGNTGGLTWAALNSGRLLTFATASSTSSVSGSEDTWVDTGLSLSIVPKSTNSTILVTGYIHMWGKPKPDSAGTHSGKFRFRLRVQPSGGSESTVGQEMLGTFGMTTNATYFHYIGQKEWQWVYHEEYANSSTTQKAFHIECEEQDQSVIDVNKNAGRSFINALEVI